MSPNPACISPIYPPPPTPPQEEMMNTAAKAMQEMRTLRNLATAERCSKVRNLGKGTKQKMLQHWEETEGGERSLLRKDE